MVTCFVAQESMAGYLRTLRKLIFVDPYNIMSFGVGEYGNHWFSPIFMDPFTLSPESVGEAGNS